MAGGPAVVPVVAVLVTLVGATCAAPQEASGGMVQKIGDSCQGPADCERVENGVCDPQLGTCRCPESHPIQNVISCLPATSVNETCSISAQCQPDLSHAECLRGLCVCSGQYYLHTYQDGVSSCLLRSGGESTRTPVDPVMIGILASMVLMFVIICVVLRLFSKAQFRQNRTILNSANPRLMNASFLKGPLLRSPVDQLRRNSRSASITSLRREEAPPPDSRDGSRTQGNDGDGADASQVQVQVTRDR